MTLEDLNQDKVTVQFEHEDNDERLNEIENFEENERDAAEDFLKQPLDQEEM